MDNERDLADQLGLELGKAISDPITMLAKGLAEPIKMLADGLEKVGRVLGQHADHLLEQSREIDSLREKVRNLEVVVATKRPTPLFDQEGDDA